MYEYKAEITNIVDGDTIDAIVDLGFNMTTHQRFRLYGINCPEKFGAEKELGIKAKQYVHDFLMEANVTLRTYESDSFGRWLCDVILNDGSNFNDLMILNGYAVKFKK